MGGDAFGVFDLGLHPPVVFRVEIYLAFQFCQVHQLLLGLGFDWFHGLEGYLGEGPPVGCFIFGVIEDAHFVAVGEESLNFAFDGGLFIYHL